LSEDVAPAVDVDDLYSARVLNDGVDDPVVAAASRVQANQLITKGFANPERVPDERAEDELDAGRRDLFRQPLQIAGSTSGDLDLVGLDHATP